VPPIMHDLFSEPWLAADGNRIGIDNRIGIEKA
jgi:hypothetical protein